MSEIQTLAHLDALAAACGLPIPHRISYDPSAARLHVGGVTVSVDRHGALLHWPGAEGPDAPQWSTNALGGAEVLWPKPHHGADRILRPTWDDVAHTLDRAARAARRYLAEWAQVGGDLPWDGGQVVDPMPNKLDSGWATLCGLYCVRWRWRAGEQHRTRQVWVWPGRVGPRGFLDRRGWAELEAELKAANEREVARHVRSHGNHEAQLSTALERLWSAGSSRQGVLL